MSSARSPSFRSARLVIVEDADPFVSKYRKELEAYVESPYESGILLFQAKQWLATTNLAKLVHEVGLAIDCSGPRDGELAAWLPQLARARYDAQLDATAARLLVELVGPEPGILAAEVEKLAVYAGESRRIERQDVARLVGAGRVETIWKTLDAATTGQGRVALEHLDNLLATRRRAGISPGGHQRESAENPPCRAAPSGAARPQPRRSLQARRHPFVRHR